MEGGGNMIEQRSTSCVRRITLNGGGTYDVVSLLRAATVAAVPFLLARDSVRLRTLLSILLRTSRSAQKAHQQDLNCEILFEFETRL